MEKTAAFEMDLEGWELLPDQGMLSIYGKGEARRSSSPKETVGLTPKDAAPIDLFPDQSDHLLVESIDYPSKEKQHDWVDPGANCAAGSVVDKLYPDEKIVMEVPPPPPPPMEDRPVNPISAENFRNSYEGEDSEEEKAEEEEEEEKIPFKGDGVVFEGKHLSSCDDNKEKGWLEGFGFSIWRWRLTGIGALCSIGVAAATICIFMLGGHQRHRQQHQTEKIQFQIYTDDKNLKQIVQHASRLNQVISASRGAPPVTRANISFGGYYDGL